MTTKAAVLLAVLFVLSPTRGRAQTITVDVKVVNVLTSVRDRNGHIIANLGKDDFLLEEDGRPQTVRYFAQQTDLPLSLGLMVDTSASQFRLLESQRAATNAFFGNVIRPDHDVAFVLQFDNAVTLLQGFTSSRPQFDAALRRFRMGLAALPDPRRNCGGRSTVLYEAISFASNNLMRTQQGRKALIVLTDGVDYGSCESLDDAIEFAQRADVIVYSIFFFDQRYYEDIFRKWKIPGRDNQIPNGQPMLQRISKETGGRFFEISNELRIDRIYATIEEELRKQYNLGYSSDRPPAAGYRTIRVTTKDSNLIVQARHGYYASPNP